MGIFSNLFRKGEKEQKTDKVKVGFTIAAPSGSPQLSKADKLLKEATDKKKSGDIKGAVGTLRDSYKIISKTSAIYPIETYLRLPLYLQEAGEKDKAWAEFNELIMWINTKPRYSPRSYTNGTIYHLG